MLSDWVDFRCCTCLRLWRTQRRWRVWRRRRATSSRELTSSSPSSPSPSSSPSSSPTFRQGHYYISQKRQSRESPPRQLWKLLSRKLLHIFFVISSFSFASLWFSGLGSGLSLVIWRWHWCYWAWCWCCWAWCWCYWALLGWYYWEWCWCYWAWFWCYSALFWCFWKRCWCYWGWLHLMHLSGDRPIHCLQNPAWAWHDSHTEVNIHQMHTCIGTFKDIEIHL